MYFFLYSIQKLQSLLCSSPLELSLHSGFCTWSYRPIEPLAHIGPNQFISHGEPFSVLYTPYRRLRRGELVVHVTFPAAMVCSASLFWEWCALVQAVQNMFVPIGKGGHPICSAPTNWLSSGAGVFQNIGTSSFCIHSSPRIFLDVYPNILQELRIVPTSVHRTAVVMVLHLQIFSGIHPPLLIHHMLVAPFPLLSCNVMI